MGRVGMDLSPLTRARTGVGHYTHRLIEHLLAAGGASYLGFAAGRGAIEPGLESKLAGLRRVPLPIRVLYASWSWTGRPRVDRLLGGVDVFHATNYFLPPVHKSKRVVTIHDLAFLKHPEWCSPKIRGTFSRNIGRFAREADALLTVSQAAKEDVVELLGVPEERITVTHNAVDGGLARVSRDDVASVLERYGVRQPYVLFVSTLEPRKNVEGLLEAFAALLDDFPHTLVLVGQWGWGAEPILAALERPALRGRVHRVGYVARHADLGAFYSGADAFFFPSFYEGFGIPVLEAMTCGAPVVTSDRSALPEVAGDAARYVDPDDVEAMAAGLRAVLEDTALRERLREAGFARARKFSWADCAARTYAVYRGLV